MVKDCRVLYRLNVEKLVYEYRSVEEIPCWLTL